MHFTIQFNDPPNIYLLNKEYQSFIKKLTNFNRKIADTKKIASVMKAIFFVFESILSLIYKSSHVFSVHSCDVFKRNTFRAFHFTSTGI